MEKKLLKILEECNANRIDAETAKEQVLDLFDVSNSASSNKDTGDFRDPQNYESQDEYFGRK